MKTKFYLLVVLCSLWLAVQPLCAQKMPEDLHNEKPDTAREQDDEKYIRELEYAVSHDSLSGDFPHTHYQLGVLYKHTRRTAQAIAVFEAILKTYSREKQTNDLYCKCWQKFRPLHITGFYLEENPRVEQHRFEAAVHLHNIYFDSGNYQKSLEYFSLSDTLHKFTPSLCCSSGVIRGDIETSLGYAAIYKKMGNYGAALASMVSECNNEEKYNLSDRDSLIAEAKQILDNYLDRRQVKKELDRALADSYHRKESDDGWLYFDFYGVRLDLSCTKNDSPRALKKAVNQFRKKRFYRMLLEEK